MDLEARMKALIDWIRLKHDQEADGCKGGCWVQSVTYCMEGTDEDLPYWRCQFGGYCFGNLERHEEVEAKTFDELESSVKAKIENAIMKECE